MEIGFFALMWFILKCLAAFAVIEIAFLIIEEIVKWIFRYFNINITIQTKREKEMEQINEKINRGLELMEKNSKQS